MIRGRNIICFGPTDWWAMNPSCTTHIMRRFIRSNRVLYINPFSSDLLGVTTRSGLIRRIVRKLKSISKFIRRPQKGLYVFSPVFLPIQGKWFIDVLNNFLLKLQIKTVCMFLRMSKPVLWVENLRAADTLEWFDPVIVLYHVSDLFKLCRYSGPKEILHKREQTIREKSDVLVCVSKKLYDLNVVWGGNVFYLPHGVDFELFHEASNNGDSSIKKLANVPRPVAGYYGTLTNENDIELLLWCAEKLPDVSFVFAGEITGGDYSELVRRPNVYFLGKLPYRQIPHLCACFDVCMLPWKMNEWIKFCSPLKFFEYMASGKPIVSVPIEEVADNYSDIVSVVGTKEEYCKAITWEINNDTDERAQRRIEAVKEHSWDSHIEQLSRIISEALETKTRQQTDLKPMHSGGISK